MPPLTRRMDLSLSKGNPKSSAFSEYSWEINAGRDSIPSRQRALLRHELGERDGRLGILVLYSLPPAAAGFGFLPFLNWGVPSSDAGTNTMPLALPSASAVITVATRTVQRCDARYRSM